MKLSVSNIAWPIQKDEEMYSILNSIGYSGIEIAPSRIWGENPYTHIKEAVEYQHYLKEYYNLEICSLQSIWFGKNENIFGTSYEREILLDYTKRAIEFAEAIDCHNLVFGCPKNRQLSNLSEEYIAVDFFRKIGYYAEQHHTSFSLEANPIIYNTNFMNTTEDVFRVARLVNNPGCKINLDMGAIIQNRESLNNVKKDIAQINHVHISEPYLKALFRRPEHQELYYILLEGNYKGYVSIEVGNHVSQEILLRSMLYIKEIYK